MQRGVSSVADVGSFGDDPYVGLRAAGYDDATPIFQWRSVLADDVVGEVRPNRRDPDVGEVLWLRRRA